MPTHTQSSINRQQTGQMHSGCCCSLGSKLLGIFFPFILLFTSPQFYPPSNHSYLWKLFLLLISVLSPFISSLNIRRLPRLLLSIICLYSHLERRTALPLLHYNFLQKLQKAKAKNPPKDDMLLLCLLFNALSCQYEPNTALSQSWHWRVDDASRRDTVDKVFTKSVKLSKKDQLSRVFRPAQFE